MIFAFVFLLLTVFVWLKPVAGLNRVDMLGAWGTKVFFGIAFMYIHTRIYGVGEITVDWEEYFADSITLKNVAFQDFGTYLKFLFGLNSEMDVQHYLLHTNHWSAGDLTLMNDSRNVLRVNSLLAFISNGNVYVHVLFFSFFSYLGFRELFLTFKTKIYLPNRLFWWGLFLLPSVGFWTSSILKEPIMITGFGFFLHGLIGELHAKQRTWRIFLGAILMLGFKPYVFMALLVGVFAWFLFLKVKRLAVVYLLATVVLVLATVGLIPKFREGITHHLTRKQYDFINVGEGGIHVLTDSCYYLFPVSTYEALDFSHTDSVFLKRPILAKRVTFGTSYPFDDVRLTPEQAGWRINFQGTQCGSFVAVTPINNSYLQLLKNIPEAFWNAGFRPVFGDPGGGLKYVNIVETILLWIFVLMGVWFFYGKYSREQRAIIWLLAVFAVVLLVLIGWTTPILGALVRYRMPAYLALFLIGSIGIKKKI